MMNPAFQNRGAGSLGQDATPTGYRNVFPPRPNTQSEPALAVGSSDPIQSQHQNQFDFNYGYQNGTGDSADGNSPFFDPSAGSGYGTDSALSALDQQLQDSMNDINQQMSQLSAPSSGSDAASSSPRKPFGGQAMPGFVLGGGGPKKPFGGQAMPGMGNPAPGPSQMAGGSGSSAPSLMTPSGYSNEFSGPSGNPLVPNGSPFGRASSNPSLGGHASPMNGSDAPSITTGAPVSSNPSGPGNSGPNTATATAEGAASPASFFSPTGPASTTTPPFRGSGMVSNNGGPGIRSTVSAPNLSMNVGSAAPSSPLSLSNPTIPSPTPGTSDPFVVPPVPPGPLLGSEPPSHFANSISGDMVTDADLSKLQELQAALPASAIASGELKAGSIYKLGGKKPFLEWQVRRCVVTTGGKMQYYDPKKVKNSIRGELVLKGSKIELINDGNPNFARLKKLAEKLPKGVNTSFFQLKPPNVQKVYFFAVPSNERDEWIKILHTSEKAEQIIKDQQALQMKIQNARQMEQGKAPSGLAPLPSPASNRPPSTGSSLVASGPSNPITPSRDTFDQPLSPRGSAAYGSARPSSSTPFASTSGQTTFGPGNPSNAQRPGFPGTNISARSMSVLESSPFQADPITDDFSFDSPDESAGSGGHAPHERSHHQPQEPHNGAAEASSSSLEQAPAQQSSGQDMPITLEQADSGSGAHSDTNAGSASQAANTVMASWGPQEVCSFLESIGQGQYGYQFYNSGISGWNLIHFSVSDMMQYLNIPQPDADFIVQAVQLNNYPVPSQ